VHAYEEDKRRFQTSKCPGAGPGRTFIDNPDKGNSIYLGDRDSRHHINFYEKGVMEGDEDSSWVRVEHRFKGDKQLVLPWGLLRSPKDWWETWAYGIPALVDLIPKNGKGGLQWLRQVRNPETEGFRCAFIRSLTACRLQFGPFLAFLESVLGVEIARALVLRPETAWGALDTFPDWDSEWDYHVMLTAAAKAQLGEVSDIVTSEDLQHLLAVWARRVLGQGEQA
jgi:DNA relaxase NicK